MALRGRARRIAGSRPATGSLRLSRVDNEHSSACHASASITGCVRKRLLRLRDKTTPLTRPSPPPTYAMVPSLRSGILIAPPACCIHRPRRNASSPGYRLLALRRVSPRIRRTASLHVAQFGTRPLVPCLTFHRARFSSQLLHSPTSRQRA